MKFLKIVFPFFLLALFWASCEDEPKQPPVELNPQLLIGKWNLTSATKDKVSTERLDGAYMEFSEGEILKTNIFGLDEDGTYSFDVKGKKLTQNTAKNVEYKVEKLINDTLVMNMKINSSRYEVLMEKERKTLNVERPTK